MARDGELEWNTAAYRVKFISQIATAVRQSYATARRTRDLDDLKDYFQQVAVLYEELRIYLDQEKKAEMDDAVDKLETKLRQTERAGTDLVNDIRNMDRKLQEVRRDQGLDIPSKTKLDEEEALTEGLM